MENKQIDIERKKLLEWWYSLYPDGYIADSTYVTDVVEHILWRKYGVTKQ